MRGAVQVLYERGRRVHAEVHEHWGELEVYLQGRSLVGILRHLNGNRSVELLPRLYEVHLMRLCDDVFELRGYEKAIGWHLQIWSCRRPTAHEIALSSKRDNSIDPDYLRFQRWWPQLLEYTNNRPHPAAFVEVGEIIRLLGIAPSDAFRFIDWLCESGRAYNTATGSALGSVQEFLRLFKNESDEPWLTDEQAQGFLSQLIPQGISQFFFFDGEQIHDHVVLAREPVKRAQEMTSKLLALAMAGAALELSEHFLNTLRKVVRSQRDAIDLGVLFKFAPFFA